MNTRGLARRAGQWVLPPALASALSGCISASMAAHPYSAGWKILKFAGEVDQMAPGIPIQTDCRTQPHADSQRYGLLLESHRKSQYMPVEGYWIVPVAPDSHLSQGDEVFANSLDCSAVASPVRRSLTPKRL